MTSTDKKEDFFPAIGSLADKTDNLPDAEPTPNDEEERPLQEIESLCMKCGEQVAFSLFSFKKITNLQKKTKGHNTNDAHLDPLLPRSHRHVLPLRPLRHHKQRDSIRWYHSTCVLSPPPFPFPSLSTPTNTHTTLIAEGTLYTAKILSRPDLNRQIVRSPHCTIQIPQLELTLPSTATSQGQLTTVEGLVRDVVADLSIDQPVRRYQEPGTYEKIEGLIGRLRGILGDDEEEEEEEEGEGEGEGQGGVGKASEKDKPMPAFTIKLDDPSGNSWIEFIGSMADPQWNLRTYPRTLEQNVALGLVAAPDEAKAGASQGTAKISLDDIGEDDDEEEEDVGGGADGKNEEIFVFHGTCSSCGHPLDTLMKKVNIPYFKDVLIMSTNCDRCGYRDNEVKSGSAISEKGKKITLKVEDKDDMSRDILKSETAGLTIPEIDLVLTHGTLGGRFTTLEGILEQVYEELSEKVVMGGDSTEETERSSFVEFLRKLKEVKSGERPFTVILDDPLANSYIQNLYAPDADPGMEVEVYERTWEQNESLGLNDMKVEGYEEDHAKEQETGEGFVTIQSTRRIT
ncbi:nucleolar zinc-finger protein [Marasmius tenuissimus]|uniref:Nucleolar zinc-finger protein n=1 Tax=Marasmius tenuissimus TaxID=585030 RepID=A0ABR2ZTZ6_9AGAR